jgi:hypothetical protein
LVFRLEKPVKGVILLRIGVNPEKRLKAMRKLLQRYELKWKFIVLKEGSVRIRAIH